MGWFGEGDDRFYIDGEESPSLRGTGTEDYFGDAWGFRQFSRPYYGVSLWEGYFPGDRVTAYRWHLQDPIPFSAFLTHSVFGSRYQPFLDDKPIGPELDLCISGHDPLWVGLDLHELSKGKHTLRFEGRGPSPRRRSMAPQRYAFGLTYLILLRLEDLPGYHEVLHAKTKAKAK